MGHEYLAYREYTPENFAKLLVEKVQKAGDKGTVHIAGGVFDTYHPINLPNVQVTIKGAGKYRTTIRLRRKRVEGPGFINVGSNGTIFQSFRVDCMYGLRWIDATCAINTNGFSDVTVRNAAIKNSGIGIGTPNNDTGLKPDGLTITDTTFIDCKHGVLWNRLMSATRATYVQKIRITNCQFKGEQVCGISIDAGNDGLDGNPGLGNKRTQEAKDTVTNMDDMEIRGCTFERAVKYNVALAKVWNVNIIGNHFKGASAEFGESVNIEHSAYDILVKNNKFTGGVLKWEQAHVSILTFRDYRESRERDCNCDYSKFFAEDGCSNITIEDNIFRGNVWNFVRGEYARQVYVYRNRSNYYGNIGDKLSFDKHCSEIHLQKKSVSLGRVVSKTLYSLVQPNNNNMIWKIFNA